MWDFYERSSPIAVKGGIKAQTKKGQFSNSWWGKRWIDALESFQDSGRLSRGRSYARQGQVLNININPGEITAHVQGSRPTPYKVKIELEELSKTSWQLVIDTLSKQAIHVAKLLAGELPAEVEQVFQEVNIQLLPSHHGHLKTDCSCPDWSNPCKHVAAVLYLLGAEFDRDPFLLFKARGMDREAFLKALEKKSSPGKQSSTETQKLNHPFKPLSADPITFWQTNAIHDDWLQGSFDKPHQNAAIINSLGKFPFWRGENNLQTSLAAIYEQVTKSTLELLQGAVSENGKNR